MGSGCYRVPDRELFFAGGYCENGCFRDHGGCEASSQFKAVKTEAHCELKPDDDLTFPKTMAEINKAIDEATSKGKTIFLYTPDMFSETYLEGILAKLPERNGSTYIAINASVRNLVDRVDWAEVYKKGIREIWMGVESASLDLRNKYHKIPFTNEEVLKVTKEGEETGINICWFLVDGAEDTTETRLQTYQMIKEADPYRTHIGNLQKYQPSV